tara:strand:+ start:74348 stop:74647 length:300 start_codon:yes stop_codon:yes gene_type:complete
MTPKSPLHSAAQPNQNAASSMAMDFMNTFIFSEKSTPLYSPKLPEPRMSVITGEDYISKRLRPEIKSEFDKQILQALIFAWPGSNMNAHRLEGGEEKKP